MPKVTVSIPRLAVSGGFEKNKEIYVLAFALDMNTANDGSAVSTVSAAYNETLPNIAPELADHAAYKWLLVTASNTFERVSNDQPVSLSGSGILLYPNLDPGSMLALHFCVIECDRKTRQLGDVLGKVLNKKSVKGVLKLLEKGLSQQLVASMMGVLVSEIPGILKANRDDLLLTHNHSGFDFDTYGVSAPAGPTGTCIQDFPIANDRCSLTLRVRVNP